MGDFNFMQGVFKVVKRRYGTRLWSDDRGSREIRERSLGDAGADKTHRQPPR
jgi:hypothetical protein